MLAALTAVTLAGCTPTPSATLTPVDDALGGMAVDVVRIDLDRAFFPWALASDGAVLGARALIRQPFLRGRIDVVVVEPSGEVTVIARDTDTPMALGAAISETSVAWSTPDPDDDRAGHLYVSSRSEPEVRDLTPIMVQAGLDLPIFESLALAGDTVIGESGGILDSSVFAITPDSQVMRLATTETIGISSADTCLAPDVVSIVMWERDEDSIHKAALFEVTADGAITRRTATMFAAESTVRGGPPIARCRDLMAFHSEEDGVTHLALVDLDSDEAVTNYVVPDEVNRGWFVKLTEDYALGMSLDKKSGYLVNLVTGHRAEVPTSFWCSTSRISGEFILWQENTSVQDPSDSGALLRCSTYVGRLAPTTP